MFICIYIHVHLCRFTYVSMYIDRYLYINPCPPLATDTRNGLLGEVTENAWGARRDHLHVTLSLPWQAGS